MNATSATPAMSRPEGWASLSDPFDVLVIGGGATGLGIAVDAVARGFRTALVEAGDFAQATSSRATKLVHGGVRYLASGQIHLVYEALHERAVMLRNAPCLVRAQAFLLPTYSRLELPYYAAGLMLYDGLSGRSTMGPTRVLGPRQALVSVPNLARPGLSGGILYHDGQFNDARFALALARTAADLRATVLNYARCTRLLQTGGKLTGALVTDVETGVEYSLSAKTIFNAAGIFVDEVRRLDAPAAQAMLTHSRGTHIVVGPQALGGEAGIMIPKTRDGRVIFAVPWQGRVVVGTTDLPATEAEVEPSYADDEISYLLETINPYLAKPITAGDVLSVFSGLRPLVSAAGASTSRLSREHSISIAPSGLITVAGGKWTTYRRMAQDALDFAMRHTLLPARPCRTDTLPLHGMAGATPAATAADAYLLEYGTDASAIQAIVAADSALDARIDPALPYTFAEVVYAVRAEMARTVDDVLSRRTRSLLLDAAAASRAAEAVASVIARELGRDDTWRAEQVADFERLVATHYQPRSPSAAAVAG